ncbi:HD domain-containing phosphohydrolase [Collinsella sp. An2]|uniref:HD domain-containing phosphohydrolase n=1 Tax=Collinsella sp. An2 TaxID=1965585 RepID=UPI000B38A131|nr:HD domain-containing phosphohydrolase [Collinsella sp. An2]OUP08247.1 two-component system response regulator [Collinsella sp. An2]
MGIVSRSEFETSTAEAFDRVWGLADDYGPIPARSRDPHALLIADDDAINRLVLANLFGDHYEIDEAEDGTQALAMVLNDPLRYAAILLDYQMEGMNGIEVLQGLARVRLVERIPTFLISAEVDDAVTERAYALGVMDVVEKPIIPYVVNRRVGSVIELFSARRRLSTVVQEQQTELVRRATTIIELNRGMIEALAAAIEFRDGESGDHVRRIHDITHALLTDTDLGSGLSSDDVSNIALASIMHDVGKIAIPDAILCKPGRLTPEEFETMKTHTVVGAEMLAKIPQMRRSEVYRYAVDIARHHHERWDGRGYPDGIGGSELSMWAQVVSIADVYDALRSKRVYKDAYGRSQALNMIEDGACGTFNPKLLATFRAIEPRLNAMYVGQKEETRG